jgi:hypothetical protein
MPYGVGNIGVGTNKIFKDKDNVLSKVQTKDCLLSNNGFAQEVTIYDSHRLMYFSRPIQWYHYHADPIWPDGTFQNVQKYI